MLNLSLAFDLDGTLVNSEEIKTSSYIQALQKYKLFKGNILSFLGRGYSEQYLKEIIIDINPASKDIIDSVLSMKNNIYMKNINKVNLFEDAKYLLNYIKEINLNKFSGIVTSSSRDQVKKIMNNLSLDFPYMITSSDTKFHKPNPEPYKIFKKLLRKSEAKKLKFVAIEDTIKGVLSAEAANYDFIFLIDRDEKLKSNKYNTKRIRCINSLLKIKDFIEDYRLSIDIS